VKLRFFKINLRLGEGLRKSSRGPPVGHRWSRTSLRMADRYLLSDKHPDSLIWVEEGEVGKVACCTKDVMGGRKKLIRISIENDRKMKKM
jgi:hypothetical protein